MTTKRSNICCPLLLLAWGVALADGGHIALHATSGPTTVTVFTAPEPLVPGRADISVLVQDAGNNASDTGATVKATLTQGTSTQSKAMQSLAFTRSGPVLSVAAALPAPGSYTLTLSVVRPGLPTAIFTTALTVQPEGSRRTTLVFAMLFPAAVIVLFLINQQLKANRRSIPASH